jgi:hypothetical protein
MKSEEEIYERLGAIQLELGSLYQAPMDSLRLEEIPLMVLNEISEVTIFLNGKGLLNPWAKDHIVAAIKYTINRHWFYAAINSLLLAIEDPERVSLNIVYDEDISNLNFEALMEEISKLKRKLDKGLD